MVLSTNKPKHFFFNFFWLLLKFVTILLNFICAAISLKHMASALRSVFLSNNESIRLYSRSQLFSSTRQSQFWAEPNGKVHTLMVWASTHRKMLRAHKEFVSVGSKCSRFFLQGVKIISSSRLRSIVVPQGSDNIDVTNETTMVTRKKWSESIKVAIVLIIALLVIPKADAVDALKTCTCLLKECRVELAKCIANPSCAANVACLQTCNNRPDETECQIKCGDLFENKVVDEFNECAVSRKKCVPQKSDLGEFPVPDPSVLVPSFDINDFSGKWYITSGLNPTFDTFDCQLHEFHTESNKLVGNISWRIQTPDSGFFTRSAVQKFVQDPKYPGILYNHDNEYLHYQDDWYILSSKIENKPDDYIFVYYKGRNDAWDGYGGAVIYTRTPTLPESIIPELEKASQKVGRTFNSFIRTNNTCPPEPPLVERIEKTVEKGERTLIKEVEEIEQEVEKVKETELNLFSRLLDGFKELQKDEENFLKELSKEEQDLLSELKMEASQVEQLFGKALPIRKIR